MRKKDDANEGGGGGGEIPDKQIGINNILPQKYNFETRGRIINKIARKGKDNKRVVGNGLER